MKTYKVINSIIILLLILLISCRTNNNKYLEITDEKMKQVPNEITNNVVLIPQNDNYSCGTTSVAMAISYFEGIDKELLNKDTVWNISGSSIQIARTKGFELQGFQKIASFYKYKCDFLENIIISELEFLLSKGALVIIFIRLSKNSIHAVLVTGYNKQNELVYINDPSNYIKTLSYDFLKQNWNAQFADIHRNTKQAGFIVYPKEKIISN